MAPWSRLIRFTSGGQTHYGEPTEYPEDFQKAVAAGQIQAKVISAPNGIFGPGVKVTDEVLPVEKLLCPIDRRDCPSIKCIGLNYKKHSACPVCHRKQLLLLCAVLQRASSKADIHMARLARPLRSKPARRARYRSH